MHRLAFLLLIGCAGVFGAQAASLDGRTIVVEAADRTWVDVPLSLACDATPADGERVRVKDTATGKEYPATLRNGELVFVAEGPLSRERRTLRVEVVKDSKEPRVLVTRQDSVNAIDVVIDGVPFTTYHYAEGEKKPYLWPVHGDGGVRVTRDFPMGEKELSDDHPHHRSMWTSYGDINGADCWMEGEKAGWQVTKEVTFGSGDAYGWILAKNTWTNGAKEPVISEEREYRFYAGEPRARQFDVGVTFKADYGDALFKDTKEGGIMSLRIRDVMTEQRGGVITTAAGVGEKACWGKPSPWCDYSGTIEGAGAHGIAVFDHPTNLRHPSRWHVRAYGLLGANCFGLGHFTNGEQNGDYTLKSGDALTFRYRVYIHRGDVSAAKVSDRFADYAEPPIVRWGN
jgi:hypothetical protein